MNAIERIIQQCSGQNGLTNFKKMELNQFIKWFEYDISFNGEDSRNQGYKAIKALKLAKVIASSGLYDFEDILNLINVDKEHSDILYLSNIII